MSRLQEAIDLLDLRDWCDQYTKTFNVNGHEWVLETCPVCSNNKRKVYVNEDRKVWVCHRCDWRGGDPTVLMAAVSGRTLQSIRVELLQTVIPSTKDNLYDAALQEQFLNDKEWDQEIDKLVLPTELPGTDDFSSHVGQQVMNYALSRGLTEGLVDVFGLRAATDLRGRTGPFLVFPVAFDYMVVAWQGRRVNSGLPKYISSENIGEWLWPSNKPYWTSDQVVLVEGVFDAIGGMVAGIPSFCTFGKKIGHKQIRFLKNNGVKTVVLGWDANAVRDMVSAAKVLSPSFDVKVLQFGKDSGDEKIDIGDAISNIDLQESLKESFSKAIPVNSTSFYELQLLNKFGEI